MDHRQVLRKRLRECRRSLSPLVLQQADRLVAEFILAQLWFFAAKKIGFYWAMGGEISLQLLMEKTLRLPKTCYLPVCLAAEKSLQFVSYQQGDILLPNRYHIPEPQQPRPS